MDPYMVGAFLTGLTGLIALFFGRQYWLMLSRMVDVQTGEITRLQDLVRRMRDTTDEIELKYYQKESELNHALSVLDNYVTSSQYLSIENQRLRFEKQALESEVSRLSNILNDALSGSDPTN
jgi:chromosome segregation ATPase